MKNGFLFLSVILSFQIFANILELPSRIYGGDLYINDKKSPVVCYFQVNTVAENETRGKHCHDLNVQMMFGLDDSGVHSRDMEVLLMSRRTNNDTEFNLPGTCAEVVSGVQNPRSVDRWGNDESLLYNQVFAAWCKVNRFDNHYIVIFDGKTKTPKSAMIHRVKWLREDSYECRNLQAM